MSKDTYEYDVKAVIDADSLIWQTVLGNKNVDDADQMTKLLDDFIRDILVKVNCRWYMGFVGGKEDTFRHELATTLPYKGNRPETPDLIKKWRVPLKTHMKYEWGFMVVEGIEADDACAICQSNLTNTVLCSPDKDLLQVPGNHFNYQRNKWRFSKVGGTEADKRLYTQVLTGDATDNIPGLEWINDEVKLKYGLVTKKGLPIKRMEVGAKTAEKLIDQMNSETYEESVRELFNMVHGEEAGAVKFQEMFDLVFMLREETESFKIPKFMPFDPNSILEIGEDEEEDLFD